MKKLLSIFIALMPLLLVAQNRETVDNNSFFEAAISFIDEGYDVVTYAKGQSMRPFILDGEKVLLEKCTTFKEGDIVLARLAGGHYVLHRIYSISNKKVILMGDGNLSGKETCPLDSLKALCRVKYDANNKEYRLDTDNQKDNARIWKALLPQRELLLKTFYPAEEKDFWSSVLRSYHNQHPDMSFSINPRYDVFTILKKKGLRLKDTNIVDFSSFVSINQSAEFLFDNLKGRIFTHSEMTQLILKKYDVDESIAARDCLNLLINWYSMGVVRIDKL